MNVSADDKHWVGPTRPWRYIIYKMQNAEAMWYQAPDCTQLDPEYSEFSIRLHDPNLKSLSFINRTLAILPKSRIRVIYALLGRYLDEVDDS